MMREKNIFKIVGFLLLVLGIGFHANAETADEILSKASSKIKNSKGVNVSYTISSNGKSFPGVLKSSGKKFYVNAAGMETWYNGSTMYTYNPSSKETTLVNPTAADLSETNPLLYLDSYSKYFNSRFSKNKKAGLYIIDLIAKTKRANIKKLTVFLDKNSLLPKKFIITTPAGDISTITINKLTLGAAVSSSAFDYPKSRLSDVNIIDLR